MTNPESQVPRFDGEPYQHEIDDLVSNFEPILAMVDIAEFMHKTGMDNPIRSNGKEAAKQLVTRYLMFAERGRFPSIGLDLSQLIKFQMLVRHPEYDQPRPASGLNLGYLVNKFTGPQIDISLRDPIADLIRTEIIFDQIDDCEAIDKYKASFQQHTGFDIKQFISVCLDIKGKADANGGGIVLMDRAVTQEVLNNTHPLSLASGTLQEHREMIIDMNRPRVSKELKINPRDVTIDDLHGFHGLKTISSIETKPLIVGSVQGRDYVLAPIPELLLSATSVQNMKWQMMTRMSKKENRDEVNDWMGDINEAYLHALVQVANKTRNNKFVTTINLDKGHNHQTRADYIIETQNYILVIEQKSRSVNLDFYFDEKKYTEAVKVVQAARGQICATIEDHRIDFVAKSKPIIGIIVNENPIRAVEGGIIETCTGISFPTLVCNYAELTNLIISDTADEDLNELYEKEDKFISFKRPPANIYDTQIKLLKELDPTVTNTANVSN